MACPQGLSPLRLYESLARADDPAATAYRLADCTGCGACDAACPSRLVLAPAFVAARTALAQRERLLRDAETARRRFEARNARLARIASERAGAEAQRARDAASPDAVQAALARARARKRAAGTEPET